MLLGRLAVIFFPGEIIFRCNLLSLLATALSAGLLTYLITIFCSKNKFTRLTAAAIALFMAFTPVWWDQGTSNEVYALTLLLNLLVMVMMVSYSRDRQARHLVAGFYVLGLSFGVHLSTIFLIPALIYLVIATDGVSRLFSRRYALAVLFLIAGLSLYIYLPIRASFKPFLNWSNPASLGGFINHISGWQYRVWMFGSFSAMQQAAGHFLRLLFIQFGVIGLGLACLGLFYSFKNMPKLAFFAAAMIIGDIGYSINYEIVDINSYYLVAFACLALFAAVGLSNVFIFIRRLMQKKPRLSYILMLLLALALPAWALFANFSSQNKSDKVLAARGVEMTLASMDKNGLAIVENWDLYSPWLYYRYALNVRPDVVLIDKELLRRSWYLDFLRRSYPEITESSRVDISRFLRLLEPFENRRRFDPAALTAAYRAMIGSIVANNRAKRPVYTNILGDPDMAPDLFRNPIGVIYRLDDRPLCLKFDLDKLDFDAWDSPQLSNDPRARIILAGFARAVSIKASLCHELDDQLEAKKYAKLALRLKQILE